MDQTNIYQVELNFLPREFSLRGHGFAIVPSFLGEFGVHVRLLGVQSSCMKCRVCSHFNVKSSVFSCIGCAAATYIWNDRDLCMYRVYSIIWVVDGRL